MILDEQRSIGQIVHHAALLYRVDWPRYLLLAALVVVPADLLVLGFGLGELSAGYAHERSDGALILAAALYLVVYPLVAAMTITLLLDRAADRPPDVRRAAAAGFELFAGVLVVVLLATAGVTVGLLVLVVPGLFLSVRLAVAVPAVLVDGHRGMEALRRSWSVTDRTFWRTAATLLLAVVPVVAIVGFVIGLPADALAREADAYGIVLAGAILADVLVAPYAAIVSVLLFADLRARKAARDGDRASLTA